MMSFISTVVVSPAAPQKNARNAWATERVHLARGVRCHLWVRAWTEWAACLLHRCFSRGWRACISRGWRAFAPPRWLAPTLLPGRALLQRKQRQRLLRYRYRHRRYRLLQSAWILASPLAKQSASPGSGARLASGASLSLGPTALVPLAVTTRIHHTSEWSSCSSYGVGRGRRQKGASVLRGRMMQKCASITGRMQVS